MLLMSPSIGDPGTCALLDGLPVRGWHWSWAECKGTRQPIAAQEGSAGRLGGDWVLEYWVLEQQGREFGLGGKGRLSRRFLGQQRAGVGVTSWKCTSGLQPGRPSDAPEEIPAAG